MIPKENETKLSIKPSKFEIMPRDDDRKKWGQKLGSNTQNPRKNNDDATVKFLDKQN